MQIDDDGDEEHGGFLAYTTDSIQNYDSESRSAQEHFSL
jgi:hypothetical protein